MNLLITGAWHCEKDQLESIKKLGHNVVFMQREKEQLPCSYEWVEGTICNGLFLSHPIENFTNLRYIQLTSAGLDRIPIDYIKEKNITLNNAKGVYSIPMAEFAISGVLDLYKKKQTLMQNQKDNKWVKQRDLKELFDKKVCIIGCGNVGQECAKRFHAFGCEVFGIDIYHFSNPEFVNVFSVDDIDLALPKFDVIVLTLPLTEITKNLLNRDRIFSLKDDAIVVNIARGGILDEDALYEKIKSGNGGAVLDVFLEEPLDSSSPLWELNNVLITPHNSFVGDGNNKRLSSLILNRLKDAK